MAKSGEEPTIVATRVLIGVAVVLAAVGAVLLLGGPGSDDQAESRASGTPTSSPRRPAEQNTEQNTGPATPSPAEDPDEVPYPTWEPTAPETPEPDPTASPIATSATGPPTEPADDPHVYQSPSAEEIASAPPPTLRYDFYTDVPAELAGPRVAEAWTWLVARLEGEGWSHLELIENGAVETRRSGDATVGVRADLGYSGVDWFGHVGVGRVSSVWLELKPDGRWKVVGYGDPPLD